MGPLRTDEGNRAAQQRRMDSCSSFSHCCSPFPPSPSSLVTALPSFRRAASFRGSREDGEDSNENGSADSFPPSALVRVESCSAALVEARSTAASHSRCSSAALSRTTLEGGGVGSDGAAASPLSLALLRALSNSSPSPWIGEAEAAVACTRSWHSRASTASITSARPHSITQLTTQAHTHHIAITCISISIA